MGDDTRSVLYLMISGAPAPKGAPALVWRSKSLAIFQLMA
jgi:hypothetical protein